MPEKHSVVIIDGNGWKEEEILWLKAAAKKYTTPETFGKRIEVSSLTESMT